MKALEVHTCPLWELPDGARRVGMERCDRELPVVGWVSVLVIELNGQQHELLVGNPCD